MQSPLGCWMLQRQRWVFYLCVCVACSITPSLFCDGFLNFPFSFNFTRFHVGLKRCDVFSNITSDIVLPGIYLGTVICFSGFWYCFNMRVFCPLFMQLARNIKIQFVFISLQLPLSSSLCCSTLFVYFRRLSPFPCYPLLSHISHSQFTTPRSVCCHLSSQHAL